MKKGILTLRLYVGLLLLLFYACPLLAQTIQYENQIIEQIQVELGGGESTANFDTQAIIARIKTHQGNQFSHLDFDADLKALAREFDHVLPKLESMGDKIYITLQIWPKPNIRTISYIGNEKVKTIRLQKELAISPSTVFDRQAFNKAFHKLKAYYVKKGFFEAELEYDVNRDETTNEVDIVINIKEGRAGRIKEIVFHGFTSYEESELLEMIVTKKYNLFTSWLTNQGTYNEEAVQQDQFTILNYLQNEGYADANVEIKILESKTCNRIILDIQAERGEKYFFGDITFEGNTLFDNETIREELTINTGLPYSPDEIRESIRNISNTYGRQGFIDASINFEPKLDCEARTYSIHFTIEEGRQYYVGMVKVYGNNSTQTRVILHETLLVPGEVFNIEKLQKTEERLRNIGYFKHVNVYAVKSEGAFGLGDDYRDINIEVEETGTGHFSTSFGISSVESYFGTIAISEKNFNYKGLGSFWKDGLKTLRGGGEYLNLSATFGNKSRKYELSWTKPYFRDTKWTVGFDAEISNTRFISDDYDIDASGITFHASYQNNPFLRTGYHYRLRNTHINVSETPPLQNQKNIRRLADITDPKKREDFINILKSKEIAYHKLRDEAKHSGLVSAFGATLYYDSTDHPMNPSKGLKSRLGAEIAGIGGYHSFLGLNYLNTYYYKLHQTGALKFRLDVKFIIPYGRTKLDNMPIDERLFLGGDETIRGYRSYQVGPHFGSDEGDPSGGLSLQFYSAEYNKKIFKNLDGFIFFDAGHLSAKYLHFGCLSLSAGYGIRIKLLDSLPELTFGMGYPLNEHDHGKVKKFFFQMGGRF